MAVSNNNPARQSTGVVQNDEIDLFEIWNGLIEEKVAILTTVLVVLFLALLYAFFSPKTFEVTASFLPPLEKDVVALNFPGVVTVTWEELYQKFTEVLSGPALPIDLIKEAKIHELFADIDEPDLQIKELTESVKVTLPSESKIKSLVGDSLLSKLVVEGDTSAHAMLLSQTIIESARTGTKEKLISDLVLTIDERLKINIREFAIENARINNELAAEVNRLKEADAEERAKILYEMDLLRTKSKENREYQISRLQADFALAQTLSITQPIDPLDYKKKAKSATVIDVTNTIPSRYWMGTEILGAEIKSLQARENEDPYVEGLSELTQKLKALDVNHRINTILARTNNEPFSEVLRKLIIDKQKLIEAKQKVLDADFEVARVVQEPIAPSKPIKPKKMLIVAVAGLLGLMLGVFIALIRRAAKNRKAQMAV